MENLPIPSLLQEYFSNALPRDANENEMTDYVDTRGAFFYPYQIPKHGLESESRAHEESFESASTPPPSQVPSSTSIAEQASTNDDSAFAKETQASAQTRPLTVDHRERANVGESPTHSHSVSGKPSEPLESQDLFESAPHPNTSEQHHSTAHSLASHGSSIIPEQPYSIDALHEQSSQPPTLGRKHRKSTYYIHTSKPLLHELRSEQMSGASRMNSVE